MWQTDDDYAQYRKREEERKRQMERRLKIQRIKEVLILGLLFGFFVCLLAAALLQLAGSLTLPF